MIENTDKEQIRLNKYLSDAGFCSRREADRLIEAGKVLVDGKIAVMGQKVMQGQVVSCEGKVIEPKSKLILIAFNKPSGVECTTASDNPDNIVDFINYPERIYPVGRLDKASTGLILLTNTGELVNEILRSVNNHEKEYLVRVDKPIDEVFVKKMGEGILLKGIKIRDKVLDIKTKPCFVQKTGKQSFKIILSQGINRQIRRMCSELGFNVTSLHRIRIMNIMLGDLPEGQYRNVTEEELGRLIADIKGEHND